MALRAVETISAVKDLQEENTKTFEIDDPFFYDVIEKKNLERMDGPYISFVVTPTGPGNPTSHPNSTELFRGGLRESSAEATEYLGMGSYTYDIPMKHLLRMGGTKDMVKLLERYPDNAMIDFKQRLIRQFYMGNEDEMETFFTLNGQQNYNPEGNTSRPGLFEANAPADQTATVFGLTKNSVNKWHHQYEDISSFRTQGVQKIRQGIHKAQMTLKDHRSKGIKQLVCDQETFFNYVQWAQDRVIANDTPKGDGSVAEAFQGMPFMGSAARIIPSEFIDLTQFTGAAANGVLYGLDPATWTFFTATGEHDGLKLDEGWFRAKDPYEMQDQPVIRSVYFLYFNAYCSNIAKNLFVTGGALA